MRKGLSAAMLISALLISGAAQSAQEQALEKWAFFKDKTPKGTPLCMLATAPTKGETIKSLTIKKFGGSDHLNITMYKDSWSIPSGKTIRATIDFMDDQPLEVDTYGDGKIVDLALPKEATAIFIGLVKDSSVMRISFISGNEAPWKASLVDAHKHLKSFVDCAIKQESTQPF